MSLSDKLPPDEIMQEMARIALEQATSDIAKRARECAQIIPPDCDGRTALTAFANAIETTNAKTWPKPPREAAQ